jgi:aspartate/methionine/tyrosine aminotransferase
LQAISRFACERDLILISDEIYEAITYEGHRHVSPASLSAEMRERCIVVNSLSKTYAMTGWRLGYCAGPAEIIGAMLLILQQSSRGPATFIQDAGVAALSGPQDCIAAMREEYSVRRKAVGDALFGIAGVRVMMPEGGFFTMLDIGQMGRVSNDVRQYLLREHGVVVVHGSAYGEAGEGTLRVSFGSGGDNLARGLERLRKGLESL